MDYKQKIKEYLNSDIDVLYKNMLLNLFPELKESEDERIKREIIGFIRNAYWTSNRKRFNELVAWLEKQGGHNPTSAWSEEDKNFMYDTLSNLTELKDRYGEGYGNVGKCIDWLKSLKERYAWKPSDEQMAALSDINCTGCISYAGQGQELINLYNDLKNLRKE